MNKVLIAGGVLAAVFVVAVLALVIRYRTVEQDVDPAPVPSPTVTPASANAPSAPPPATTHPGFLYGRITTGAGTTYEGRLRWGGGEEAFWGDYFNGAKDKNPWIAQLPPERRPPERHSIEIFGLQLGHENRPIARLFMARFGDIARIEARGRDVRVTLKSGTAFDLNRMDASDFDDGVRVWDGTRGVVNLDSLQVRTIELLPTAPIGEAPDRLQGTVHTRQGDFTGFVQWDREACVGADELYGHTAEGELNLRFDTIRSIARRSPDSCRVTQVDGREIVLEVGNRNRGIYVDDARYGRVLISWDAFDTVDFGPGGSGPAYGDFPAGRPLTGSVTTRAGGRLTGRVVYDLDESETTETFDAPSRGIDYTIPFGLIASIVPQNGRVALQNGEELQLELDGDLGDGNAGMLVFVDGAPSPTYVPWTDIVRVDFDRPPAMYPPLEPNSP